MGTNKPHVSTSANNPLRIHTVETADGGAIGMTLCPGKLGLGRNCLWERDLDADLAVIFGWRADMVITLMEDHELVANEVNDLSHRIAQRLGSNAWLHLPIVDGDIPDQHFEKKWELQGPGLHKLLRGGGRILVHCLGGLGRTGTIAARLLVETGVMPETAINRIREARPGAIETRNQEIYVRRLLDITAVLAQRDRHSLGSPRREHGKK